MDKVQCDQCGKSCVPRLWHYTPILRYMKTQHICPFCGSCMYESGGGLTLFGKVLIFLVIVPLPIMLAIDDHDFPTAAYVLYCVCVAPFVWGSAAKLLLERFRKA